MCLDNDSMAYGGFPLSKKSKDRAARAFSSKQPQVQKIRTKVSEEYKLNNFPREVLPPAGDVAFMYKIEYKRGEFTGEGIKREWQKMDIYFNDHQAYIDLYSDGTLITGPNFFKSRLLNMNQNARKTLLDRLSPEARNLLERALKEE